MAVNSGSAAERMGPNRSLRSSTPHVCERITLVHRNGRFKQEVGWDLTVDAHASTSFLLYMLFVIVSLAVAAANVCRNWILVPPFRRIRTAVAYRAEATFRRQALSLRRWMILNILAWGAVTVSGLIELVRGTSVSRSVGMEVIAGGLAQALEPSTLFFLTLIILYVARWHILWRAERIECRRIEAPDPSGAVAGIIEKTED